MNNLHNHREINLFMPKCFILLTNLSDFLFVLLLIKFTTYMLKFISKIAEKNMNKKTKTSTLTTKPNRHIHKTRQDKFIINTDKTKTNKYPLASQQNKKAFLLKQLIVKYNTTAPKG